jgi:cytochrome c551/c552
MKLCTASETISFIRELEEKAAALYDDLAGRFAEQADDFSLFAKESRKYIKQVQMAYQSVITDAIEGCFAFDLEADDYALDTELAEGVSLKEAAAQALAMEETIVACYSKGAEQSGPLLADVPRNFKIIIRKRGARLQRLKEMI